MRSIVSDWFAGRPCVLCGRQVPAIHLTDRKPALRSPNGYVVALTEVPPLDLDAALSRSEPICANCYDAMSFREQHPGLAIDRPKPPTAAAH